jgi:hypothetical protein
MYQTSICLVENKKSKWRYFFQSGGTVAKRPNPDEASMTDQIIQSANPAAKTSHSTQLRN